VGRCPRIITIRKHHVKKRDVVVLFCFLTTEKKQGKIRLYSLNRKRTLELVEFFEDMYDYNLMSLKEYVEAKEKKNKKTS
jgi:hypothetical protein